ncbi:Folate-Biopterin transporter (FBT) family [Phytophthora cinnamomi]|nr:Folate-Biopterin transporter (FBT) family [Phytophthora cinnamomi]
MCALWVFLAGSISPGYSQVFFYFTTEVLHFTPEFLGTISAFGYIFLMAGTMLYNTCFKDMSFRRIFFIAQLSLAVVSLLDAVLVTRLNLSIGIPDKAFVLGDAVLSDIISRLKTMPVLVLCAKLCPKGIEGTLFALLMSISNFSYSVSESWGAIVCGWLGIAKDEYNMLWLAIVLCSILKLAPIAFLFLIPAKDPQEYVDGLDLSLPVHGTATKDSFHESEGIEVEDENLGLILTAKDCSPMEEIQLKERQ